MQGGEAQATQEMCSTVGMWDARFDACAALRCDARAGSERSELSTCDSLG